MEIISLIAHNLLSFIVILSAIVFIHEFGHYWVAKRCGVKIEAFSIGFGKELYGWNDASGTRWKIVLLPLGGYVKMFGDQDAASTPDNEVITQLSEEEKKTAFATQRLRNRFAIVAAGPAANFILAIVILTGYFGHYGRPETLPVVGQVQEKSAASKAGLQIGDVILSLNGTTVERFEDIRQIIALHPEQPLEIKLMRKNKPLTLTVTPKLSVTKDMFGNEVKVGLLGIVSGKTAFKELSFPQAVVTAFTETYTMCVHTLQALGQMITGKRSTDELSGVLRIAQYSGQSAEHGLSTILWFMAILSINLGLINLLPVPMLDGGHLFFYIIEGLLGKPLPAKVQDYSFRVGFVLLIGLMLLATFNDLRHFGIF